MKLVIKTFWKASAGCGIIEGEPVGGAVTYLEGGGHPSVKELRRELKRRFAHRNPMDIPNGIRCNGDGGTYQDVTLE